LILRGGESSKNVTVTEFAYTIVRVTINGNVSTFYIYNNGTVTTDGGKFIVIGGYTGLVNWLKNTYTITTVDITYVDRGYSLITIKP
jgi:hypothetical protein